MRVILTLAGASLLASSVEATDVEVGIELPRIRVAEYHKPYVAAWISTPNRKVVANLAVWYQLTSGTEGHGTKWLKDIRQWWRRAGRSLTMPVDGVSAPTKAPGRHTLSFSGEDSAFRQLADGDYILHVEASREVGGREMVSIPFSWGKGRAFNAIAVGSEELGEISLVINP